MPEIGSKSICKNYLVITIVIKNFDQLNKTINVSLSLTKPTNKVRVKQRSSIFDYGEPFASRKIPFNQENYIEWQVGYQITSDNKAFEQSTLQHIVFKGAKSEEKSFYELSEYLYYFYKWRIFSKLELLNLRNFIENLNEQDLLDKHKHCRISRTNPHPENINQMCFHKLTIKYPQLIYKFNQYDVIVEITIREKQRAIGVQPMLYFCLPITELKKVNKPLIGRQAEIKEVAYFEFNQGNASVIMEMVKIFGMLSQSHQTDILGILTATLEAV